MEIFHKLQESESIVIEGDRRIGKLTFALYILKKKYSNVSLISPLTSNQVAKRIEALSQSFIEFNNLADFIDAYSFREDWVDIKNEYGFKYLLQDLEYFIETNPNEVIVFHRIGHIFEYSDRDLIEYFFTTLLSYGIKHKKKLVFLIGTDIVNYDLVSHDLVESSDLYLKIYKEGDVREIEVLFALSPIIDAKYVFESKQKKLFFFTKEKSGYINKNVSLVVIAKDEKIQRINKYLLDKPQIELKIIDSIVDSLDAILQNPDYILYFGEDNKINPSICELRTKYNLYTKILYMVNKEFIRVDDRLNIIDKGCVDLLNFNIPIINYVLEISKYIQIHFYKIGIIRNDLKLKTKDEVIDFINYLLKGRILFSIVKIDEKLENIQYLRNYDKYIEFEDYNIIIFVNLLKHELTKIIFSKMDEHFHILKIQDSLDIFYGEKLCID